MSRALCLFQLIDGCTRRRCANLVSCEKGQTNLESAAWVGSEEQLANRANPCTEPDKAHVVVRSSFSFVLVTFVSTLLLLSEFRVIICTVHHHDGDLRRFAPKAEIAKEEIATTNSLRTRVGVANLA